MAEPLTIAEHDQARLRFWPRVETNGPTLRQELGPCWIWTASIDGHGYGNLRIGRRVQYAHRVAWWLHYGRWPEPCCLHKCDVRNCVRVEHLFEGTKRDNSRDMVAKGRCRNGELHGEDNALSKLTHAQVLAIRQRYAAGGVRQRELAAEFGVSVSNISIVVRRKGWAHL